MVRPVYTLLPSRKQLLPAAAFVLMTFENRPSMYVDHPATSVNVHLFNDLRRVCQNTPAGM